METPSMYRVGLPIRAALHIATAGALAASTAAFPARSSAQYPNVRSAIDAYLAPYVATNNFSGQLLVMRGTTVVYDRQFGFANRERRSPNGRGTRFHVASVSMQFTAAAAMRLVDAGKLSLDTKVSEVVPGVVGGERISVRNLLEMRSGLQDINSRADYAAILQRHQTPASLVALIPGDSLLFPPGARYAHEEHSAYNLLALVIEKRSGQPFAQAIQQLVFEPAGMRHSGVDDDSPLPESAADGYDPEGVYGLTPTTPIHWSAKTGNASIYTTAEDEARFVRALTSGKLLSASSRAIVLDTAGPPAGYGWFRRPNTRFDEFAYSMSGRSPGFASYVLYLPREDLTIIAFSNIYSSSPGDIGGDVAAIALGRPYAPLAMRSPPLRADSLGVVGASFAFEKDFYQPNATLRFDKRGDELFMLWPSGDTSPIIPLNMEHLIDRSYWEPITIARDSTGRATGMTYDRFSGRRVEALPTDSARR
jgi:CubicO group peptidase (beta-lactamase class C family)